MLGGATFNFLLVTGKKDKLLEILCQKDSDSIACGSGSELVYFCLNSKGFCGILVQEGWPTGAHAWRDRGTGKDQDCGSTGVMEGGQQHRDLGLGKGKW